MNNDYFVNAKRWSQLSIFEQMGNIYSEVGRSLSALNREDRVNAQQAMARAVELFNLTIVELAKAGSPRTREVLRAREQYLEAYTSEKQSSSLDKYFLDFALAARRER